MLRQLGKASLEISMISMLLYSVDDVKGYGKWKTENEEQRAENREHSKHEINGGWRMEDGEWRKSKLRSQRRKDMRMGLDDGFECTIIG